MCYCLPHQMHIAHAHMTYTACWIIRPARSFQRSFACSWAWNFQSSFVTWFVFLLSIQNSLKVSIRKHLGFQEGEGSIRVTRRVELLRQLFFWQDPKFCRIFLIFCFYLLTFFNNLNCQLRFFCLLRLNLLLQVGFLVRGLPLQLLLRLLQLHGSQPLQFCTNSKNWL